MVDSIEAIWDVPELTLYLGYHQATGRLRRCQGMYGPRAGHRFPSHKSMPTNMRSVCLTKDQAGSWYWELARIFGSLYLSLSERLRPVPVA